MLLDQEGTGIKTLSVVFEILFSKLCFSELSYDFSEDTISHLHFLFFWSQRLGNLPWW